MSTNRVPFLDVGAANRELRGEIGAAVARVLEGGWFILGNEVCEFETAWAAYTGAAHGVGTGNGLDALHLILLAAGVGEGDEVIVPSNTYIATWLAVTHVGATPVAVEPDPDTFNIDPAKCPSAITDKTKALIPVHLYGQPADMDPITSLAHDHSLFVLEDAAQAHGARYKGRPVGSLGDAAAWSFYPSKNLGAIGDAGAVTTSDGGVAERVRLLRNYGSRDKYIHDTVGYNSRLDELQAAVLLTKLSALERWNQRRRAIAEQYLGALGDTALVLPHVPQWAEPVWHIFAVRSSRRDALRAHLDALGVETSIHYPRPPHLQNAYQHLGLKSGSLPISEAIHREVLSLPIGPHMSDSQVDQVIEAVRSFAA